MTFSQLSNRVFQEATRAYHIQDHVDAVMPQSYTQNTIEYDLFKKNWIDAVQWHLEDIIRKPEIDPKEALLIKRRIDHSNQERTDLVERIDTYFFEKYQTIQTEQSAVLNTESPAWAIDRLSILVLKIWHMRVETERADVASEHLTSCSEKLSVLLEQQTDLSLAIDQLLADYQEGKRKMKVYKQMKMYNDPSLNPSLYKNEK
jgi:hypothetical protein